MLTKDILFGMNLLTLLGFLVTGLSLTSPSQITVRSPLVLARCKTTSSSGVSASIPCAGLSSNPEPVSAGCGWERSGIEPPVPGSAVNLSASNDCCTPTCSGSRIFFPPRQQG